MGSRGNASKSNLNIPIYDKWLIFTPRLFGSFEIKSGEKYLLIILENSAKDYLERFREGFCFQIQFFFGPAGLAGGRRASL
jgi:hypothetical protein